MASGGWIAYLKILQTSLSKWVSKTKGEANLALAQLSYASNLYKLVQGVDIWERNKELIRKRTDIGEHFTWEIIQSIVFIFYH